MAQINQSLFGATALSNGLLTTNSSSMAIAPSYSPPPVGRAYDRKTGELVTSAIELRNPGSTAEVMQQWHLKMLGDIGKIWQEFTGRGVSVGVYDSGVQKSHWDLAANYDASKHVVIDGTVLDGEPVADPFDSQTPHGTSVAGLIAAARNGRGGVGVAYDSKVTGVNLFDPSSPIYINGTNDAAFVQAIQQFTRFDVTNNSYGPGWNFFSGRIGTAIDRGIEGSGGDLFADVLADAAAAGRDGLGTLQVFAAGNDGLDGQFNTISTARHSITVGSFRQLEAGRSSYSNFGPHLLVSAPSNDLLNLGGTGQVTTDLLGTRGYNWSADPTAANDYTDRFGGTSGAAPIVAGVISLMLDANENLGWRDVRAILAASAKMPIAFDTGPVSIDYDSPTGVLSAALNMSHYRLGGEEANWNGGRMHYSNDYGYGAVDAYSAVRMAEVWSLFAPAKTSANEISTTVFREVGLTSVGTNMTPDGQPINAIFDDFTSTPTEFKFTISDNIKIDHIDLQINFTHILNQLGINHYTGLFFDQLKLIAPDGTEAFTGQYGFSLFALGANPSESMTLGFSNLQGVESAGTWTLQWNAVNAFLQGSAGVNILKNSLTINSLKMDVYGSTPTSDDVHTYTNEFFTMTDIAGEAGRKQLNDTDGGTDWINAAAVSSNVALSLVGGQSTSFGGETAFTIGRNTVIENAVTGDGNDTLIGNRFDNKLYGMRGNDTLNGGAGNDTLFGGTGNDRFLFDNRGTSGTDTVLDWMRDDLIGTQTALRGVGSDGRVTVAANATLLLDGTAAGDTVLLSQNGGAVLQAAGQSGGYFWYSYLSGTTLQAGDVIREAGYQPERTAAGAVAEMAVAEDAFGGASVSSFGDLALTGMPGDQPAFHLYDPMAASMNGGVLLYA